METAARRTAQILLGLFAALVALMAAHMAGAQTPPSIDAIPGMRCAYDASVGEDWCALPIAPGVDLDAPRSAWLPVPDGFFIDFGEKQIEGRFCPGSLLAGRLCFDTLRGTERKGVPHIPFLDAFVTQEPPLTTVGLDYGANLVADDLGLSSDLSAMLAPDGKYFVYHTLTSGLNAEIPGLELVKISTGGDPTTFVVGADFARPFFYYEGEFKLPFGKKQEQAQDDGSSDGSDGDPNQTQDPNASQDPNQTQDPNAEQAQQEQEPQPEPEQDEQEEGGAPVFAVAIDSLGGIPFTPLRSVGVEPYMTGFHGHMYVRGPVPINPLVELDGTVVVDLDPDEDHDHPFEAAYYTSPDVEIGGNGALAVVLPFDFVDLSALGLELGEATAQAKVSEVEDRVVFTGIVTSEDFLASIPIPIRQDRTVEAFGRVSAQDPLGSYVHLEGRMSVSLAGLGQLTGLPLGEIQSTDAVLDLNAMGVTLQGSTMSQIHPAIASGALALTVHVPTQGNGGFVELRGDVVIANQAVRDATIRIDAAGMRVNGTLIIDDTSFAMVGAFAASGYRLEGSVAVGDPIALNAQSRAAAELTLAGANAILTDVRADFAAASADLAAALRDLATAQSALSVAQTEVDRIQSLINGAVSSRTSAYNSYRSWVNKSCAWYDAVCQSKRAANITYYYGRYTYFGGLVTTYSAAKAVATAALDVAKAAVSVAQVTVGALASQVALIGSQVAAAENATALAQAQLDALPDVSGSIEPIVTLILEDGLASGRVDATWNGVPLGGGTVRLSSPAEACVEIPGQGTLCTPL
jgi:hypothetical protein